MYIQQKILIAKALKSKRKHIAHPDKCVMRERIHACARLKKNKRDVNKRESRGGYNKDCNSSIYSLYREKP